MKPRRYVTVDVFTQQRFGGNPLAVVLDAEGLTSEQMQLIAREFNYSETTFVLPPKNEGDYEVRIFTPSMEVPFAGHPNIGTAIVLAHQGLLPENSQFVFEEKAGDVPVILEGSIESSFKAELTAPEALSRGQTFAAELIAQVLSLPQSALVTDRHKPQKCSVGLPAILVELDTLASLQKVKINTAALDRLLAITDVPYLHVYVRSNDDFDMRARFFAPTEGVPEDPATGSANCTLAALNAELDNQPDSVFKYRIAQGVEMGRPSELNATIEKNGGQVVRICIAGFGVLFSQGMLSV